MNPTADLTRTDRISQLKVIVAMIDTDSDELEARIAEVGALTLAGATLRARVEQNEIDAAAYYARLTALEFGAAI